MRGKGDHISEVTSVLHCLAKKLKPSSTIDIKGHNDTYSEGNLSRAWL